MYHSAKSEKVLYKLFIALQSDLLHVQNVCKNIVLHYIRHKRNVWEALISSSSTIESAMDEYKGCGRHKVRFGVHPRRVSFSKAKLLLEYFIYHNFQIVIHVNTKTHTVEEVSG